MLRLFCFVSNVYYCVNITKNLIKAMSIAMFQVTIIVNITIVVVAVFYQKNLDKQFNTK